MHVRGVGNLAVLSITDTGKGMSEEVKRLAFEPFFTTRGGEGGSGLGLALAQEIVQRYGGTISLQSAELTSLLFATTLAQLPALLGDVSIMLGARLTPAICSTCISVTAVLAISLRASRGNRAARALIETR